MMKQIAQGAEAILYKDGNKIIKERVRKDYRIPEIDLKLRKERTRSEAKILRTLQRAGVNVPSVLREDDKEMVLEIAFLDGEKLRDYLENSGKQKVVKPKLSNTRLGAANRGSLASMKKYEKVGICKLAGIETAKMHAANIVHGDLTTSNLINKNGKIFLIDFGLGEFSKRAEDKAVDLHLFKECLVSKHHKIWEDAWKEFTNGYKNQEVINRLKVVEARGRYKSHAL